MPNFAHSRHGVITRIGVTPSLHPVLYGTRVAGAHVDALAVHYDADRWQSDFGANWPPGSPAHLSYSRRLAQGPDYHLEEALKLANDSFVAA